MTVFSDSEKALLVEILETERRHLRVEINRADAIEYKHDLWQREASLEDILGKLGQRYDTTSVMAS